MSCYTIAKKVVQKIVHHGYIAYFAGGCVRDRLLNHPFDDIDIATDAPVEEIQKLFSKTIPVGIQFGILIVVVEGHQFEVATFRKETGYKDGRRPNHIEKATPQEDAQRRDFTINGMFFDPISEQIHDFVNGQEDLQKKLIRAIGDPHERFLEDRLRMIRAVRYAARLHFSIDPPTIAAILTHAPDLFPAVAIERIVQELKKMSLFPNFPLALSTLHRFQLLHQIFPQLNCLTEHELSDRLKHLPHFPSSTPLVLKLFELFGSISLEEKMQLCDYLKLSTQDKRLVEELHLWLQFDLQLDDYDLATLYAKPNAFLCLDIAALHSPNPNFKKFHQRKLDSLTFAVKRKQSGKTLVTSAHLKERGVAPGPEMGKLLAKAERVAVNHRYDSVSAVLNHLNL